MKTIQELQNEFSAYSHTPEMAGYDLRLDLSYIIVTQLDAKGWSQKQLAEAAGVPEQTITRLVHSASNCGFELAGKILFALGVKAKLELVPPATKVTKKKLAIKQG